MSTPAQDHALLIESADSVEAQLAKELLESNGIPVMIHGVDRAMADLGAAANMEASRPNVYVPKSALAKAVKILSETWENFEPLPVERSPVEEGTEEE